MKGYPKGINTLEEKEKEQEEEKEINSLILGEYNNVCLTSDQYGKLLSMCLDKDLLNELINSFSVNIEVGKERPYNADLPNAHYERLKAYYSYRKKYPDKFNEFQEKSWHSVIEEMRKASG